MSAELTGSRCGQMMRWLPAAADFRSDLRTISGNVSQSERLERLAALARHRLDFVETLQLARALDACSLDRTTGFRRLRLALLASSTVDHLAAAIRVAGLRRSLLIDVYVGAYGQYRQELLGTSSRLHRFAPEVILLSLTASEVIAGVPLGATAGEAEAAIERWIGELRALWRNAHENLRASVVQQTFVNVAEPIFGSYDRLVMGSPSRLIGRLNDRVSDAAAAEGVAMLDVARATERDGLSAWFDPTRWLQAKQEIAPQAAPMYGELVARVVGAQHGKSRKCLVLDLDNTLWGGIIGDEGLNGIVLGQGSALGEAHLALQGYVKQLAERGVILAVCSKNDPVLAEAAFEHHPDMVLQREDISAFVANWDDKALNVQRIAATLNIGLDSLVFLDDSAVERDRIRQSLPEVAVLELPSDPAQFVRCLAESGYFEAVAFTSDDSNRRKQYAGNRAREALHQASQTLDDFLSGLEMTVEFGSFQAVDLARVSQLIGKTNQFNLTGRRHSAEEVARFSACGESLTLQFRLVDRCGDNGLVSVMILRRDPQSPAVFDVDTWVMSCRVFGRQLEFEAMNIAVERARLAGARTLRAQYVPTIRNAVVRDLYSGLGFTQSSDSEEGGATEWLLDLAGYVARPTHIVRRPLA